MNRSRHGRSDKLIKEKRHDVYRESGKWPDPTVCTECEAYYVNGRWTWTASGEGKPNRIVCPACRRIKDRYPAGILEIGGDFFEEHREQIMNLIRNVEEQQKSEHPLERILAIADNSDGTVVTTTGVHIARRIGEALARSHKGDFSFQYGDGEKSLRGSWHR